MAARFPPARPRSDLIQLALLVAPERSRPCRLGPVRRLVARLLLPRRPPRRIPAGPAARAGRGARPAGGQDGRCRSSPSFPAWRSAIDLAFRRRRARLPAPAARALPLDPGRLRRGGGAADHPPARRPGAASRGPAGRLVFLAAAAIPLAASAWLDRRDVGASAARACSSRRATASLLLALAAWRAPAGRRSSPRAGWRSRLLAALASRQGGGRPLAFGGVAWRCRRDSPRGAGGCPPCGKRWPARWSGIPALATGAAVRGHCRRGAAAAGRAPRSAAASPRRRGARTAAESADRRLPARGRRGLRPVQAAYGLSSAADFDARGFAERMLITQALFALGWLVCAGRIPPRASTRIAGGRSGSR